MKKTISRLAWVFGCLIVGATAHMGWDLRALNETWGVEPDVEVQEAPARVLDVSGTEPTVFSHEPVFEVSEGAFRVRYSAQTVADTQAVISKDHRSFGTGGHLTVLLGASQIHYRIQGDSTQTELTAAAPDSGELVVSFGPAGARLYVNGILQAVNQVWTRGIVGNVQPVVAGATFWSQPPDSTDPSLLDRPLQGDVSLLEFYDTQPADSTVASWASTAPADTMSFQLTGTASWSPGSDDRELVAYLWQVRATAGWSGTPDTVLGGGQVGASEPLQASFTLPFDADGTGYEARFCVRAVDNAGHESLDSCATFSVPQRPTVDQPPTPPDSVDVGVQIDTIMAMAPETSRAWVFARWVPGNDVSWYRTLVRDASTGTVLAWRNENNWTASYPWGATGFWVPRRAVPYEAELVVIGYPEVSRVDQYQASPVPLEPVEQTVWRWSVPASGSCSGYRGQQITCRG